MTTTEADIFDQPYGPVLLADNGKWWADRTGTEFFTDGRMSVMLADGKRVATIIGTPEQLRRAAAAIAAQVAAAEANTGGAR